MTKKDKKQVDKLRSVLCVKTLLGFAYTFAWILLANLLEQNSKQNIFIPYL